MATNNTTLAAEIVSNTIELDIDVRLVASSNYKWKNGGIGYIMRSTNSGSYTKIGGDYSLVPSANDNGMFINRTINYTDSSVVNTNTYRYYFEMSVEEEQGEVPQ